MVEQVQFTNNTATHGAAIDLNSTVPIPVIITQSLFDANQANILTAAQIADNVTLAHAGDGGGLRCLGGEKHAILPGLTNAACVLNACNWASQIVCPFAGDLYLLENIFEGNVATNGAAVYAEQGCGQVLCLFLASLPWLAISC